MPRAGVDPVTAGSAPPSTASTSRSRRCGAPLAAAAADDPRGSPRAPARTAARRSDRRRRRRAARRAAAAARITALVAVAPRLDDLGVEALAQHRVPPHAVRATGRCAGCARRGDARSARSRRRDQHLADRSVGVRPRAARTASRARRASRSSFERQRRYTVSLPTPARRGELGDRDRRRSAALGHQLERRVEDRALGGVAARSPAAGRAAPRVIAGPAPAARGARSWRRSAGAAARRPAAAAASAARRPRRRVASSDRGECARSASRRRTS